MTTPERPRRPARRSRSQRNTRTSNATETAMTYEPNEQKRSTSNSAPAGKKPKPTKAAEQKPDLPSKSLPVIDPTSQQPEVTGSIPDSNAGAMSSLVAVNKTQSKPPVERDDRGRFIPGNNGGSGRPLGSRNKLVEDFIADFRDAWRAGGKKALKHMADNEPASFVRAAVQLMPKDVLVEARGAGLVVVKLTDEDLAL